MFGDLRDNTPAADVEGIEIVAATGVTQFNIYLMSGEEESVLEAYGREVIPAMKGTATAAIA